MNGALVIVESVLIVEGGIGWATGRVECSRVRRRRGGHCPPDVEIGVGQPASNGLEVHLDRAGELSRR